MCSRSLLQPAGHCWRRFSHLGSARSCTAGVWVPLNTDRKKGHKFSTFSSPTNTFRTMEGTLFQPVLDRAVDRRSDSNWLSQVFSSSALIIPLLGSKSLIKAGEPVLVPSKSFPTEEYTNSECSRKPVFLGLADKSREPLFAVDISGNSSVDSEAELWPEGSEWLDLRKYGSELKSGDAGLLAYARGMMEWHTRNKFCACCGEKMEFKEGGHSLQCSSTLCGSSIYPRLDPAIIVLVTCGDYLLLGRQSRWDLGRYSVLAGFVEVGETFEMAIVREVQEESGVKVKPNGMRYIASQPWPFPQSLMVGFIAEAEDKQEILGSHLNLVDDVVPVGTGGLHVLLQSRNLPPIQVDSKELEDAKWIHRSFLKAVLQNQTPSGNAPFSVPGRHAIANFLMHQWVSHHKETEWAGDEIPTVDIDEGVFKYVLIQVFDSRGNQKLVVRGSKRMAYHGDIFSHAKERLKSLELEAKVLGGGRIEHHVAERVIHVYGFSQAYGRANHAVTVALLQQWFPFHAISFSWEGY